MVGLDDIVLSMSVFLASNIGGGAKYEAVWRRNPKPRSSRVERKNLASASSCSSTREDLVVRRSAALASVGDVVEHLVVPVAGKLGLVGVVVCVAHRDTNLERWQIAPCNEASVTLVMPISRHS